MVGILVFLIMVKIDLIRNLEKISFTIPNRLLKLKGYLLRDNSKEFLETNNLVTLKVYLGL